MVSTPPLAPIALFSDACPAGWGVVYVFSDHFEIKAGHFTVREDISILEARALSYGVHGLPPNEGPLLLLRTFVDNTSVLYAVRRTSAADFTLNNLVGGILSTAALKGFRLSLAYVHSMDNLADLPSRQYKKKRRWDFLHWVTKKVADAAQASFSFANTSLVSTPG